LANVALREIGRRNRNQSGGTWVVRVADGKGGNWEKAIGGADDFSEANNETVFDFWQAQAVIRPPAAV
jgi:hypothetical protein